MQNIPRIQSEWEEYFAYYCKSPRNIVMDMNNNNLLCWLHTNSNKSIYLIIVFICHGLTLLLLPSHFLIICSKKLCHYEIIYYTYKIRTWASSNPALKFEIFQFFCKIWVPNFENGQLLTMAFWANGEELALHIIICVQVQQTRTPCVQSILLTTRLRMLIYNEHAFYPIIVHV